MKKIIYSILISTLFFSTVIFPGTSVSAANNLIEAPEVHEGYYSESFELHGVHYFYEDTNSHTITITVANNGEETIAYKDKTSGKDDEIYYHYKPAVLVNKQEQTIYGTNKDIKSLNATDVIALEKIKEKVLNNEIVLETLSVKDFVTVTDRTESEDTSGLVNPTSFSKINYSLADKYEPMHINRLLVGTYKDGVSADLLQHLTFAATYRSSEWIDELTKLTIIASLLSLPPAGLLLIAAWTAIGSGVYQLATRTEFVLWYAYVYYQKEVRVNVFPNVYPYRAFFDLKLDASTGPYGYAALGTPRTIYKNSDYENNSSLLSTGIANYLLYG